MKADGKVFANKQTGEVIVRKNKFNAWLYFKADGKKFGYKIKKSDILDADGILKLFGIIVSKRHLDGNK